MENCYALYLTKDEVATVYSCVDRGLDDLKSPIFKKLDLLYHYAGAEQKSISIEEEYRSLTGCSPKPQFRYIPPREET